MIKEPKILYDKESKVLSLEIGGGKSADSDIHGNLVIDYDKKNEIVRINLYDFNFDLFHKNLKELRSFARASGAPLSVR